MLLAEGLGWRGMTRPWSADCQNGRKERPLGSPTDYAAAFMPNREKPWRKSRMLSRLSKNSCAEHYCVEGLFLALLFILPPPQRAPGALESPWERTKPTTSRSVSRCPPARSTILGPAP